MWIAAGVALVVVSWLLVSWINARRLNGRMADVLVGVANELIEARHTIEVYASDRVQLIEYIRELEYPSASQQMVVAKPGILSGEAGDIRA
jgi:hypothetical protein